MRLRNQVRNEALLKKVHDTLDATANSGLQQAKEQLEDAKRQFLRDLNKKDANWRDKMRVRREEEVKKMELQKERLSKELAEKQKQVQADAILNERLRRMRESYDEQQEQALEIERQRHTMQVGQQINAQKRQIDEIQRIINEQKDFDRKIGEQEGEFQNYEESENFNQANASKVPKHKLKASNGS